MAKPPRSDDPGNPKDQFGRQIFKSDGFDELFETHRPFGRSETGFRTGRSFNPSANIYESPSGLVITIEVPGIERENIDLKLDGNRLTVRGVRNFTRDSQNEEYVRIERGFGSFIRNFEIPSGADGDSISAELEHGVLTINIPIEREEREVKVNSGEDPD